MPRRVSPNVESGNVDANLRSAMYAVSAVRLDQLRVVTLVLTFKVLDRHRGRRQRRKISGMGRVKGWKYLSSSPTGCQPPSLSSESTRGTDIHIQTR